MGLDISLYNSRKNKCLMYWRKANWIVSFFDRIIIGGVDNCEYYKVRRSDIANLRQACENVLSLKGKMEYKPVTVDFEYDKVWRNEYGNLRFLRKCDDGRGEIVDKSGSWFSVGDYGNLVDIHKECEQLTEITELLPSDELQKAINNSGLVPCTGFFFGTQDIDDWYFNSLSETIKMCDSVLQTKAKVFYFTISY